MCFGREGPGAEKAPTPNPNNPKNNPGQYALRKLGSYILAISYQYIQDHPTPNKNGSYGIKVGVRMP